MHTRTKDEVVSSLVGLGFIVGTIGELVGYVWCYSAIAKFEPSAFGALGWFGVAVELFFYYRLLVTVRIELASWFWTLRLTRPADDGLPAFPKRHLRGTRSDIRTILGPRARGERKRGALYDAFVMILLVVLGAIFTYRLAVVGVLDFARRWLLHYSNHMKPPAILFLSASGQTALEVQDRIHRSAHQVRVVSLLRKDASMPGTLVEGFGGRARLDVPREEKWREEHLWRMMVEVLASLVFIVVVDARKATAAVVGEVAAAISTGLSYKLVFISGPSGETPVLKEVAKMVDAVRPAELCVVEEEQAYWLLGRMTRSRKTLPTKRAPANDLAGRWVYR